MPELAIHAAQRLATLGGDTAQVRAWLLPVWERMVQLPDALPTTRRSSWFGPLNRDWTPWMPPGWPVSNQRSWPTRAMPACNTWRAWPA